MQDCNSFALFHYVINLEHLGHSLNQSETKYL